MFYRIKTEHLFNLVFADLKEGRNGLYNHLNKEVNVRKDVAEHGMKIAPNGERFICERPVLELAHSASHEAEHAGQHYYLDHPEIEIDEQERLLWKCNNTVFQNEGRVYFRINEEDKRITALSSCLYVLQPIERDAFEYAQKSINAIIKHMHELFPDDPDFEYPYHDEFVERCKNDSYILFDTDTPYRDIDNIMLTICGYFVEEPLNEIMCEVIKETQQPFLYDRLRKNQERNLKIIEKRSEEIGVEQRVGVENDVQEQKEESEISESLDDFERK
jgi:hypothetical protein